MNKKMYSVIGLMGGVSLLLVGCGNSPGKGNSGSTVADKYPVKNLTIATQDFSEAVIDDDILKELIEAKTPIKVSVKQTSGASYLMHSMMQKNDIQIYTGYDGTEFQEQLKQSYAGKFYGHPNKIAQYVKQQEMKKWNIWVSPSLGYQDTYALAVNQSTADKYHLKTDSQAAKYASQWGLATDTTFPSMKNTGLPDFEKTYGAYFKKVTPMSYALIYEALQKNSAQAIIAYSTDGRLKKLHEIPLQDDKSFFPPYHGIVLINNKIDKEDHLASILAPLWGKISTSEQTQMNYDVDVLKQDPEQVAKNFLVKAGLISS